MKKRITAIIIFIFVLVFPCLSWIIVKNYDTTELYENREKAPAPVFSNDYFVQFDSYFADRAPYRDMLIVLYNTTFRKLGVGYEKFLHFFNIPYYTSINNVVLGKDNWLFYLKNNNLDYYKGTNLPREVDLQAMVERAEKVNDYFAAQGKEFILFICPNKEHIYSEYVPDGIIVQSEIKRLDMIVDYFNRHSSVKVIYPRDEILAQKQMGLLYYMQDTHWNEAGAYFGAQPLFNALGRPLKEAEFIETTHIGGDIRNVSLVPELPCQSFDIVYRPEISVEITDPRDYERYTTSSNKNGKHLVWFGDSFRKQLYDVAPKEFETTLMNHYDTFKEMDFTSYFENATTVVFEAVERFETQIFASGGLLDQFINKYIENAN